jgi:dTDP-6-deoxy-L-talose 4-dehydrogenase (NAD+)
MTRIAVTGSTGFIGRHVIAELSMRDVEIIAAVRPGRTDMPHLNNVQYVHLDVARPPADIFESMKKPDVLIHLAWHGLPNYRSLHHFETELPAQYRFLRQLIAQGLESLVVTGTCFEYGMQSGPLSEETETRPRNPYGFAKDVLRKQLQYARGITPFNLTWARLFYTYGEGQPETSLLPQLKSAVEQGIPSFNMSGGEQLRDFLPVAVVARHLVSLALMRENLGLVNVCSGKPQSVRALVEQWIEANHWSIALSLGHHPYPDYEPMAFWGVREKLDATLGVS